MPDETREIEAILGPYRGQRLTVSAADAENAINDHWARDPFSTEEPHPPLTDEEREHALPAAQAWADAQLAASQGATPPDPPPPEGGATRRAMSPGENPTYKTRDKK